MSDPLGGNGDFFDHKREPDRNDRLIPMINIVFLLLTFFMIAGTFHAAELLDVEPPEAQSEGELPDEGPVVLIDRAGTMAMGDERLDRETVVQRLKEMVGEKPVEVRLKADRATEVRVVLPLLKALTDAGITRVQLIAVRRK